MHHPAAGMRAGGTGSRGSMDPVLLFAPAVVARLVQVGIPGHLRVRSAGALREGLPRHGLVAADRRALSFPVFFRRGAGLAPIYILLVAHNYLPLCWLH